MEESAVSVLKGGFNFCDFSYAFHQLLVLFLRLKLCKLCQRELFQKILVIFFKLIFNFFVVYQILHVRLRFPDSSMNLEAF
jgi:hypothetical protein